MSEITAVNEEEADTDAGSQAVVGRLEPGWNGSDDKTFTYTHDQSSMRFLIKISKVGQRFLLMGMADVSVAANHEELLPTSDSTAGSGATSVHHTLVGPAQQ
jgi:hypothetical protein